MKRIFAILIVGVLLMQVFYNNICTIGIALVKKDRTSILDSRIEYLIITAEQITSNKAKFIDNGNEVVLNGEMYDIIELKKHEDKFFIKAKHDIKETILTKAQKDNFKNVFKKNPVSEYLLHGSYSFNCFVLTHPKIVKTLYSNDYKSYKASISSPPPEFV